jgi:hypothetical protein
MTPTHYGVWKMATWVLSGIGAAIVVMDPTVKVALIVAVPLAVANCGTLLLGFLNRSDVKTSLANQEKMKASMDGHFSKLLAERAQQGVELVDKTDKLSHAEGRREGIESTEGKK